MKLYSVLTNGTDAVALFDRFNSFGNGIFDITSLTYYISISVLFVFFTVQSMEKRRWI